jgi:phosphoribosylaminoimidazole-succinocarboxamide synthase
MTGEPPVLLDEVVEGTSQRYQEAFEAITGAKFESMKENA